MPTTPMSPSQNHRRSHKLRNIFHSVILIAGLAVLMSLCAWILWGANGVVWSLAGAALSFAIGPKISPKVVMHLFRARPLGPRDSPQLIAILETLSDRAGLPTVPRLNLIPSPTLNAFAVGKPADAAIALSAGLLDKLGLREISGVLAHEVSHVASNDLWIMGLADTFSRLTQIMSWFGVFLVVLNLPSITAGGGSVPWVAIALLYFAPTIGNLLQLALSRAREYDADLEGAALTGDPAGLAMALDKLERYQGRMWEDMLPTGRRIPLPSVLRSHPPTEERIRRLIELGPSNAGHRPLDHTGQAGLFGIAPPHPRPRYHWPGVWF